MRMSPKSAFTYRDYEALPNDHRRYEIHDGELCVTPAPSFEHQILLSNLVRALMRHVPSLAPGLLMFAPLDVILSDRPDETTIVQPDYLYIAPDRMALTSRAAWRVDRLWRSRSSHHRLGRSIA
jgi:Uma2 family endonuclease